MTIDIRETKDIPKDKILDLYSIHNWSSAKKPELLYKALLNSHMLLSAWDGDKLVGIANALSDGFLAVYYSHMLVHPDYQGRGVGKKMMERFQRKYGDFHQQVVVADGKAIKFYQKCGFVKAGATESMWIFQGDEH